MDWAGGLYRVSTPETSRCFNPKSVAQDWGWGLGWSWVGFGLGLTQPKMDPLPQNRQVTHHHLPGVLGPSPQCCDCPFYQVVCGLGAILPFPGGPDSYLTPGGCNLWRHFCHYKSIDFSMGWRSVSQWDQPNPNPTQPQPNRSWAANHVLVSPLQGSRARGLEGYSRGLDGCSRSPSEPLERAPHTSKCNKPRI